MLYSAVDIAKMVQHSRAKVRFYAEYRDSLIAEGMPEREAQERAATLTNAQFPHWQGDLRGL